MSESVEIHLGTQGRLVLPAALRKALGVTPGATLLARVDEGRLVIETPTVLRERVKARFARMRGKESLAESLIADRRREAESEQKR